MLKWLLSSDVTGAVTWIGSIVGLIGLYVTFLQSKAAKDAALDAKRESMLAVQAVKNYSARLFLADTAYASARLETVIFAVGQSEFSVANLHMLSLRRYVERIMVEVDRDTAVSARKSLSVIAAQIQKGANDTVSFKATVLQKALNSLAECLTSAERQLLNKTGQKESGDALT